MVYILLAPGFEEAEALIPADLLRRAGLETALVAVSPTTAGGRAALLVEGGHQITVQADLAIPQINLTRADMIVLPGGGGAVKHLGALPIVEELLEQAAQRDIYLAAICAGPTLLGRWGHLKGKQAVCYPGLEGQLLGAQVPTDAKVVVDGKLITAQAAGSAFEFGLKLVEVLSHETKAREVADSVYYCR